jgi:hypothetical protein
MPKVKIKKEWLPYFFSALVIVINIVLIFVVSLIPIKFDFSKLNTPEFWANYAITFTMSLSSFFAVTTSGKKYGHGKAEYIKFQDKLEWFRGLVTSNFLDGQQDFFIETKNKIEKLKSYIVVVSSKLSKCNDDIQRAKLRELKEAAAATLKLTAPKIDKFAVLTSEEQKHCEAILQNSDFNIESVEKIPYEMIDKRVLTTGIEKLQNRKKGYYDEGALVAKRAGVMVTFSLIGTTIFTSIMHDVIQGNEDMIFSIVSRLFMVIMNTYTGFMFGDELISTYKLGAIKEQIDIQNQFFSYCWQFGIIDSLPIYKEINEKMA